MSLDKSWIDWGTRCSVPYFAKLDEFLDFAYANKDVGSSIYCPCRKCQNRLLFGRVVVRKHLQEYGFWKRYKMWTRHGEMISRAEEPVQMDEVVKIDEVLSRSDGYMGVEMNRLVQDAIGTANIPTLEGDNGGGENKDATPGPTESTKQFLKLMQGANQPLYPGSKKHTSLSFAVRILQAKSLHGWTDASFKELLEIFNETMPVGVNLPKSYYEAQKLVEGHGYCQTYGSSDPHSFVYPHDPSAPNCTSGLVQQIAEEATKKLTDQFIVKQEILARQWGLKYDELLSRINLIESNEARTANPHAQVPDDAISGHRVESVGESDLNI